MDRERIEEVFDEICESLDLPEPLTILTHENGMAIARRYKYSVYDSMLIASALEAGCTTLYSEDMQHGQNICTPTIRNPFLRN